MNNTKGKSEWMRNYWRPMMAIVYMIVIIFDFIVAPILWSLLQYYGGIVNQQWIPLTLMNGGLFHVALGGILGVSALTRGQEKIQLIKQSDKYSDREIMELKSTDKSSHYMDEEIIYEEDYGYNEVEHNNK